MNAFPVTIYHNPACGTSRNALAMIRAAGYEPTVVEYLTAGWTRPLLLELLSAMGARPADILRVKGTSAERRGLLAVDVSADDLVAAMIAEPVLVNRPIVRTPKGTRLCRPSETVLELLDSKPKDFAKEDGEIVRIR